MTLENLTEEIRKRKQKLTFQSMLTPQKAKEMFGFDIEPDWSLRVDYKEGEPKFTFVSPDKWEFADLIYGDEGDVEDFIAISPEGKRYTRAELEADIKRTPVAPLEAPPPGALAPAGTFEAELPPLSPTEWAEEMARYEVATVSQETWQQESLRIFSTLFPERFNPDIMERSGVTPQQVVEDIFKWANERPESFLENIQLQGRTPETEQLLKMFGADAFDIAEIFAQPAVGDEFASSEDIRRVAKGEVVLPTSPEVEDKKSLWNTFYGSLRKSVHNTSQAINKLLSMMPVSSTALPELQEFDKKIQQMFYQNYTKGEVEFEDWVKKHPELEPPAEITKFKEEVGQLPFIEQLGEYIKNPKAMAYTIVEGAPPTLAALGAFAGATALTGNPFIGGVASFATFAPMTIEDVAQDLISAGASEDQAYELALPVGALIASLDVVGEIPLLRALSPALKPFDKSLQKALINRTMATMAKRGLVTFTATEFSETLTEVGQQIIQDYTVSFFDKTRDPFGNVTQTAVQTLIQVSPFAIFGGSVSASTIRNGKATKLADLYTEKIAEFEEMGYTPDDAKVQALNDIAKLPEGENKISAYFKRILREERGALGQPEEIKPPEVTPEVAREYWQMTRGEYRNLQVRRPDGTIVGTWEDHESLVRQALIEGKPVPAEVLKDYPDLAKTLPKPEAVKPTAIAEEITVITETTPTGEKIPSTIVEAPTPTEGATARVFSRIQTEPAEAGFVEKVKQGWHKFNIKMVDDLDPVKQIVDQLKKGGVELSIDENPYLLARLLRGVTSKSTTFLEYGTFGKDFWKLEKGRAVPNYTGESLQNILNEVKDPVKWRDFSTYLTARRAVELSARDIETGIEVADAQASISELEAKYPMFEGLAQRVYKYQNSLLVYANETGLISNDLLSKLRKYGNYVPFYRVFNELQAKGLMGKKMANIAQPIKRIKGSEREIINPLESIVKNTYVLISAADRNQVGIAMANLVDQNPELADVFERVETPIARVAQVSAKELGVEVEGLTEGEEEQMVDIFRPSFFVRGDEVTVLIDGKKHYYKVDPDLRDSLLRLDRESLGLLGKFLGAPARWLRAGATLSPDFMFRNPARDQLTAFAYSNYGFMPGIDFLRGMASIIKKDADYQLYKMSGAEHSMLVSMDRSYLQKTFKQIVEGKGFTEYVKHPLELFRIISELGEKGTRLGEFKKGIKSGAVPLEAGYSSRVVSLDFAQMGTTAQAINTFIAFFNANIRGWGRMISSFKEYPIRTSAKVFLGITLPSILLWAVNHDDERWREIPQWQKDLFWIVMTKENIYRIPKPFELGIIFGSVPERFLDWLVEKDPDLMKDIAQSLMEAGSPGFIPTAGLPILEWITNYSFFKGRSIVPESRKAMPPELQYTQWTSEVSKHLGELLKLSPAKIDNLFYAWTGGLGRYALDIVGSILKGTGISPDIPEPSPTLADLPVIKAFVVRNPYGSSSEAVNDFYNILEKYEAGEKYLKEMLTNDELEKFNKYKASHPELFFFADFDSDRYREAIEKGETPKDVFYSASARYFRRVASDLSELTKKENLIFKATDISPEEKRRLIDEIEMLKTDVARKALDLLEDKESQVLQDRINVAINRLGEVIEETTPLSLEEPDIHDMKKLNQEFKSILEGATVEDLKKYEGINPLAFAWVEKEQVEKTVEPILNKKVYEIDFNLKKGVTFEDYYKQWQVGLIKDSPLEGLSRRQIDLLRKYLAIEEKKDQKAFLEGLSEEDRKLITMNPRNEYLIAHPKEAAQLAIWGKAKITTREAYNEFKTLADKLDIPENALPKLTLPPEHLIDTHFEYEKMVSEGEHGSWEAQLLLKKDTQIGKQSYVEWRGEQGNPLQLSDTPLASLELKTNPAFRNIYDTISSYKDRESPQYIENEKDRQKAIGELKAKKIEGDFTYLDIERKIEVIEKGTDEVPIDDALIDKHVEYGRLLDQEGVGASSAEVMLFRVDNPDYNDFRMDKDLWSQPLEPVDQSRIPIWRIDVKYAKEDGEYNAIKNPLPAKQARLRAEYMSTHPDYRMDSRRRDAYQLTNSETGEKFPTNHVEDYVDYYELSEKGYRQERFLVDNPEFADAMHRIKGIDIPTKVPSVEYDDIYDQYEDKFEQWEGYSDFKSKFYIEDEKARERARDAMTLAPAQKTFSGVTFNHQTLTDFGKAKIRRDAYGGYIPEEYIEDYMSWRVLQTEGKPESWKSQTGTNDWYEDDWFMMEHRDYYNNVYLNPEYNNGVQRERINLINVPRRLVFKQYLKYLSLTTDTERKQYRRDSLDLDNWLVDTKGYTSIYEQDIRDELTPLEQLTKRIAGESTELDKRIALLKKQLAKMK